MDIRPSDQYEIRLNKRANFIARGLDPYPPRLSGQRSHLISRVLADFKSLGQNGDEVIVCGRVKSIRLHGGACFVDLEDESGTMQLFLSRAEMAERFDQWVELVDVGDFILARGVTYLSKRQEKSLRLSGYTMLAKALAPLPEKRQGLVDVETRYRHRELDLISNPEIRKRFIIRSKIIKAVRNYLDARGYLEVETPILQSIPGGANARPFKTHHDALDIELYLRIAPELFLKRLLVGGYERVYEIGRCFRNEGIDRDHSPEFTQVEFYQAYEDYQSIMVITEELITEIVSAAGVPLPVKIDEHKLTFKTPFKRLGFREAISEHARIDIDSRSSIEDLGQAAKKLGVSVETSGGRGKLLDAIFKYCVRPKLIQPTFLVDLPIELSPLAKRRSDNPKYAERFQLLMAGTELVNAFSELNDPVEQRDRFMAQSALHKAGDEEAQRLDEDYLAALNFGLPPAAGAGLGIDRLTAILTGTGSLREAILFPTLRNKSHA